MSAALPPRRVLLLNGVVVAGDAISRSLTLKREALIEAYGDHVRVDIATYGSDLGLPGTHVLGGLSDLLCLPAFRRADLLVYEFGVFYDLFDSVHLPPPGATRLAVWHNVTPPALAASPAVARLLQRSLDQRSNLLLCDHVFCASAFNADELAALGPAPGQVSVLELPVGAAFSIAGAKPRPADPHRIRVLFVGRIVPAKGVLELVRAFSRAAGAVPQARPELAIVGNESFSDPPTLRRLRDLAATAAAPVRLLGQLDEAALVEAYRQADLFVIPSYHEGYCVPVLEAYAAGCHVIASDAGNLPYIVGSLGRLVPAGDDAALADALAGYFRERAAAASEGREPVVHTEGGPLPESARRQAVRERAARHSEGGYRDAFIAGLARVQAGIARAAA